METRRRFGAVECPVNLCDQAGLGAALPAGVVEAARASLRAADQGWDGLVEGPEARWGRPRRSSTIHLKVRGPKYITHEL